MRDKKDHVRLWADAVCINQPDNEEKMHQIAMMGEIYNRATNVRIWLGGKSDQSDVAMDYVREIQEEKNWGSMIQSEKDAHEIPACTPVVPTQTSLFLAEAPTVVGKSPPTATGCPTRDSFVGSCWSMASILTVLSLALTAKTFCLGVIGQHDV